MGGMHGFGPVVTERDEPVFHARWEGVVRAMMQRTNGRYYNLDEFRFAIERMPPDDYLRAGYYERWLHAVETLLVEKSVITREELAQGRMESATPRALAPRASPPDIQPRFRPGDRVATRNIHPKHHTRMPRYARGKHGVIRRVYGPFPLPDTSAGGQATDWETCYAVEFESRELWGAGADKNDRVCVDLWESYLEPEEKR